MAHVSTVVIVGRMNVGKSTLFNRLSTNVKSLTLDYPGVTRDFLKDRVAWADRTFDLIDTGGISLRKTDNEILEKVRLKALDTINSADLVLLVIDGRVGVVPEDQEIALFLHRQQKEAIIVVNKMDTAQAQDHLYDAYSLAYPIIVLISAQHGTGINDLLEAIITKLPEHPILLTAQEPAYSVMLLGKPNVGKSSLMNALLKQERSIVSAEPGTTREAIAEKIAFYKETIELVDTAGIRRRRSITGEIEPLMVKSSFQALKNAHIIVLLLDASEGQISAQELKLASYAFNEQHKALILLLNKQDLVTDLTRGELERGLDFYRDLIKRIPLLPISCTTGKNIGRVLPLIKEVWERYSQKFPEEELSRILISSLQKKPLYHQSELLRIYSAQQLRTAPITIGLTVNEPAWFGPSQLAYFEKVLRSSYDLLGVPVKFLLQKSGKKASSKASKAE